MGRILFRQCHLDSSISDGRILGCHYRLYFLLAQVVSAARHMEFLSADFHPISFFADSR
jgi:hypothetical protein